MDGRAQIEGESLYCRPIVATAEAIADGSDPRLGRSRDMPPAA